MSELDRLLGPDLVMALQRLVDERVEAALADMTKPNGSPWSAVADAATYLGVSERTIGRLLERGHIRSTCIGRRRLLHMSKQGRRVRVLDSRDRPIPGLYTRDGRFIAGGGGFLTRT